MPNHIFSLGTRICQLCAQEYMDGSMTLNQSLKAELPAYHHEGVGMCPKHREMIDAGYIGVVEIDIDRSEIADKLNIKESEVCRTGNYIVIKREVAAKFLRMPAIVDSHKRVIVFCRIGAIETILRGLDSLNEGDESWKL